jgi:hypothetical protein
LRWVRSLDSYYYILLNRIFLVLHPRYKLQYFDNAGWPSDWIQTAREIVIAEFERSYKSTDSSDEESGTDDNPASKFRKAVSG